MERYTDTREVMKLPAPNEDFYQHVNGEWLANTEIPPTEAIWGSFVIADERTREKLRDIAEGFDSDSEFEKGSPEQQVRDFYQSGTDMDTRNRLGVEPLNDLRRVIADISDPSSAMKAVAQLRKKGIRTFFSAGIGEDDKNANHYALFIHQGGISLPDRDYYLEDDEKMNDVRDKFRSYVANIFQMLGLEEGESTRVAENVFAIERQLAEASKPEADARPIDENYTKYTLDEAKKEFSDIDWDAFFETLGRPNIRDFVIQQPDFIRQVADTLQNSDVQAIKDYLEFHLVNSKANGLSQDFKDASFEFNGKVLNGMKEQQPLWKTTIATLDRTILNNAIGPIYCRENFDENDKSESETMVEDVRIAAKQRIEALDWMTPETKALMLQKVDKIIFKMGFPSQWIDVSSIDIQPDAFLQNTMNAAEFEFTRDLNRLEEPYDHNEWLMPPTMVNACSDLKREMTFPAAIHQPPFYNRDAKFPINYGGLGAVIGHELTHFIDDEGCKYDLEGNVNDWWTDQDKKTFKEKTAKFVEYYNGLESDGHKVNGKLTLGENIADVGGITIAYYALQRRLDRDGGHDELDENGLTPEQQFFTGWAKIWAKKMTPELAKQRILTDPHSPGEVRTNGVLSIVPEFHEAFGVNEGDPMYVGPNERPELW